MSNPSRSHVTITLGRGTQMVNRSGIMVDSSFPDSQLTVGNERPVRDRLGSNMDLSLQVNKRMRGDGSSANAVDEIWKGVKCQIQGSGLTIRDFRKPNSSQPQRNQKIRRGKDNKNITWLIGLGKQKPVLEFQVGILK
ncbi:uncharacterized protein LOC111408709 isoform X1 [Olea europaea var. sylvestris]|uniref:uncharacterized protein LOC111408709 isoform X1 n=1 Tax=Olea europaea var. sylvestris TaxID=158386 RepID=UPI000C1D7634|nr:uncharacterized protein LOC111408709 isoform X1 [Olea europaea var. sylvestris]